MWFKPKRKLAALSLVELVVALAVLSVMIVGGYGVFQLGVNTVDRARQYTLAEFLAHDLIELTTSKRNENWNSLVAGDYHFVEDPLLGILFASGAETINEFTRVVTLSEVQRNGSQQIVQSEGTVDPDTMKVVATVSWTYRGQNFQVQLTHYLTNWQKF